MTPTHECFVTGGGTSVDGELRIWSHIPKLSAGHLLFSDGKAKSVYAVAISPSGKYLAAGTKKGLVRLWSFLGHELNENVCYIFEVYHQLGRVTALSFLSDELLLSAGTNGTIRIISVKERKHLKDMPAHSGPICSLIALGSRLTASLGTDGRLKIWDLDSLSCQFQEEGFLFPSGGLRLFPMLAFSEEAGCLCCPSADGRLHLFDLRNTCSREILEIHQGPFYAVTSSGPHLVTGGRTDRTLRVWDLVKRTLISETNTGAPILRLCALGEEKVAAICNDTRGGQSLRLFSLPGLDRSELISGLDLRALATVPLAVVEYNRKVDLIRNKNEIVAHAISRIRNPQQMAPYLQQLSESGFWIEAKLLEAESARVRQKPLHEMALLLELTRETKLSQATSPIFLRMALLLKKLNEPELAEIYYRSVRPFCDGIEDAMTALRNSPLYGLDPSRTVRDDIAQLSLAVQEMEKDGILGRRFQWQLLLPSRKQRTFKVKALVNLDNWADQLSEKTRQHGDDLEMLKEEVVLFDGWKKTELQWLRLKQAGSPYLSPYLSYAIIVDERRQWASGVGVFNPRITANETRDVLMHNAAIAIAYRSLCERSEVEMWLDGVTGRLARIERFAQAAVN